MRLLTPPGVPTWLPPILRSIKLGLAEQWDSPVKLQRLVTTSLPNAADWEGGLVYDSTTAGVKFSNGAAWASVGGGVSDGDKGDITVSASGTVWTIDAGTVTLAKQANVATGTVFYRKTAGTGAPEVQTLATLKTDLGLTGTNSGDQTITLTGDVTGTGTGSFAATIANGAVTLAKQANLAANSIIGNNTGSAATPLALTTAQTKTLLAIVQADVSGLTTADSPQFTAVNVGHASDTTLARAAAGRLTVEGVGIVRGPASSTDTALARYSGTTGDLVQDSGVLVNASGIMATPSLTGLAGAIGPTIADYFSTTISLDAGATYQIDCVAYFLKTTAGTVTWTWTFSNAPTVASAYYTATPITGFTTTTITGAPVTGEAHVQAATTMAHAASGSLSTAAYHTFRFQVMVRTNLATTIQLRATESAGTITPQAGSFMRASKII